MGGTISTNIINEGGEPKIEVNYCEVCGTVRSARYAIEHILKEFPNAQVDPTEVGTGTLDVYVNDTRVHSKHHGDGLIEEHNLTAFMDKVRAAAK